LDWGTKKLVWLMGDLDWGTKKLVWLDGILVLGNSILMVLLMEIDKAFQLQMQFFLA